MIFLGAAGSMPPFQSSHPVDHKLSVIAPTCLLAFPFSSPLHKVTSFIYSHMENTGEPDSNHIRLHPSSSCRKTDASKLQPAHIASRFEMDLRSHKVQIPSQTRTLHGLKPLVLVHSELLPVPEHFTQHHLGLEIFSPHSPLPSCWALLILPKFLREMLPLWGDLEKIYIFLHCAQESILLLLS